MKNIMNLCYKCFYKIVEKNEHLDVQISGLFRAILFLKRIRNKTDGQGTETVFQEFRNSNRTVRNVRMGTALNCQEMTTRFSRQRRESRGQISSLLFSSARISMRRAFTRWIPIPINQLNSRNSSFGKFLLFRTRILCSLPV